MNAKSIFAASLLVAGAAFAGTTEITNDLVIGVLPVPLAAEQKDVILSIPWIESGTNTAATAGVAVTNLVKTAGLTVGDQLSWYDTANKSYRIWNVTSVNGTNQWIATESPQESITVTTVSSDSAVLKRGQALVLTRNSNLNATNVYVVGQYTPISAENMTIAHATVDETGKKIPTYTLVAPPKVQGDGDSNLIDLNSLGWVNVDNADILITGFALRGPVMLVRGKTPEEAYCWGTNRYEKTSVTVGGKTRWISTVVFEPAAYISVGNGFWYQSNGTNDDINVTWDVE